MRNMSNNFSLGRKLKGLSKRIAAGVLAAMLGLSAGTYYNYDASVVKANTVSTLSAWPLVDAFDCRWIDWYTVNQSVERKIPKGVPYQATFLRNPWSITMVSVSEYEEIYNEELGVFHRE